MPTTDFSRLGSLARRFLSLPPSWLTLGAAALLLVFPARAATIDAPAVPSESIRRETLHFSSGGRDIQIDLYEPRAPDPKAPGVLVLHGAGGVVFDGPRMRRVAVRLAQGGCRAYLVHYFDRSGTLVITRDSIMFDHFDQWLETVRDAASFAQRRQSAFSPPATAKGKHRAVAAAAAPPVGIYGYSLGAFLAVVAASDHPQIGAVVEQSGGIWNNVKTRVRHMPPTLMIHGKKDKRVPFDKYALPLLARLRERGANPETDFYPDESHVFREPAQRQVREEIVAFFARRLGGMVP